MTEQYTAPAAQYAPPRKSNGPLIAAFVTVLVLFLGAVAGIIIMLVSNGDDSGSPSGPPFPDNNQAPGPGPGPGGPAPGPDPQMPNFDDFNFDDFDFEIPEIPEFDFDFDDFFEDFDFNFG